MATPLLDVSFAWSGPTPAGQPAQEGSDYSLAALIAWRPELRLAL